MLMVDVLCAVAFDLLIGDPPRFPHPIKFMGNLIVIEEKLVRKFAQKLDGHHPYCRLSTEKPIVNRQSPIINRKGGVHLLLVGGFFMVIVNLCLAFFVPYLLLKYIQPYPYMYHIINIYLLYTCLAARCLRDEALKVYNALEQGIEEARYRLSFIVGRDTKHLDEPEIIRATVETVAENTADGIIAPLCYALIGGAPLAVVYKMINTMDSMLGYINEKYRYLGFFPAKLDDAVNYIPARLTGILMNIGSVFRFHVLDGVKIMIRDRHNHKSPNCAYPEGAMAGLLGIQLGGNNVYFGQIVKKPTIGDLKRTSERRDIKRAIEIMFRTELVFLLLYVLINL